MNKNILLTLFSLVFLIGFVTSAPLVTIDSPINITYPVDSVDLNWSVNETIDWCAYSLNEGTNNTNITIPVVSIAEGTYTNESFSSGSNNYYLSGITTDNNYIWVSDVVDTNNPVVNKHYMNGTDTGEPFNFTFGLGYGYSLGVTNDNNYIWLSDVDDAEIYKYWLNGTDTGESFDTFGSGNGIPRSLTTDGTYIWTTDEGDNEVYKYWLNGTYISLFNTAGSGNTDQYGITNDGTFFWIVDLFDKEVYKYWLNGTYISSFDTAGSGNLFPRGITNNGTYFWIISSSENTVYKYWMEQYEQTPINITLTSLSEGNHNVTIYCNNTNGDFGQETSYFDIDTTSPIISIISPEPITYDVPLISLVVSADETVDTWWYSFDSGTTNATFIPDIIFNLSEGTYVFDVWANDSVGNIGNSQVIFSFSSIIPNEIIYTGDSPAIYNLMRSIGAGLGLFFIYLSTSLPLLLISLVTVGMIVIIGLGLRKLFFPDKYN